MITRRDALSLLAAPVLSPALAGDQSSSGRAVDAIVGLDAATLVARVRARRLERIEVVEAYLARIERLNPALNAYVTVTADRARDEARRADSREGARTGQPLDGLPIAHKDLFETAGVRTTAGSRLFEHHVPARDAAIVARLAGAGAIALGKTNTHELGGGVTTINPFYGTTHNPWDRTRIAGGSSGGSAAAVAAGLALAATGSDTGGSVRIPASFCGCVGFKPTFGLVSTAGLLGASPTFDHTGLLARTVADARLIHREIAGYDPADPSTVPAVASPSAVPNARLRVGVARAYFFDALAPDVARAIEDLVDALRNTGADVRDIDFPISSSTQSEIFDPIVVAEIHERFARDRRERPDAFSKGFAAFFEAPIPGGLELARAYRALRTYQGQVRERFDRVDVILTPATAVTAPPIGGPVDGALILRNTWPFNAARTPAISVPCGHDRAGLPIGVQLAAAPFAEARLFRAAEAVEQLRRSARRGVFTG